MAAAITLARLSAARQSSASSFCSNITVVLRECRQPNRWRTTRAKHNSLIAPRRRSKILDFCCRRVCRRQRCRSHTAAIPEIGGYLLSAVSWAIVGGYFAAFFRRNAVSPSSSLFGVKVSMNSAWLHEMTKEERNYILGVQSLRNSLMTATYLCTACMGLLTALLSIIVTGLDHGHLPTGPEPFIDPACLGLLACAKYASICILLALASSNFIQCCRSWHHVTFFLAVVNSKEKLISQEGVVDVMNLADIYWFWGFRALYMLTPAVLWLVAGSIAQFISSIGLVILLGILDKPPASNTERKQDDRDSDSSQANMSASSILQDPIKVQ